MELNSNDNKKLDGRGLNENAAEVIEDGFHERSRDVKPHRVRHDVDEMDNFTTERSTAAGTGSVARFVGFKEGLSASEKLQWWFAHLNFVNVDLMSQMGGSSGIFLIHAESLILKFALERELRTDYDTTPQYLKLVYYIENFLRVVQQQCGGLWRLVFLDDFKPLLKLCSSSLVALREALLVTCQMSQGSESTPLINFFRFPSCLSEDFRACVIEWEPAFILMEDASALRDSVLERLRETCDDDDDEALIAANLDGWTMPYALLYTCLKLGMHVAVLFDIRVKGRKLYAFSTSPPVVLSLDTVIAESLESARKLQSLPEEATVSHVETLLSVFEEFYKKHHGRQFKYIGLREFFIALTMRDIIQADPSESDAAQNQALAIFFGKLLLLTSQVARALPIAQRSLTGFDFSTNGETVWDFSDTLDHLGAFFLEEIAPRLEALTECDLNGSLWKNFMGLFDEKALGDLRKDLVDFVDTALLKTLAAVICQSVEQLNLADSSATPSWLVSQNFINLSEQATEELNVLLEDIVHLKDIIVDPSVGAGTFFPWDLTILRESIEGSVLLERRHIPKAQSEDPELLVLQCPFFQKLMEGRPGCEHGAVPKTRLIFQQPTFGTEFWTEGEGRKWIPSLLLDYAEAEIESKTRSNNAREFVTEERLKRYQGAEKERMRRKLQLQISQKGAARVHKLGSSLGLAFSYNNSIMVAKFGHPWAKSVPGGTEGQGQSESSETPGPRVSNAKGKPGAHKAGPKLSAKAEAIVKKNEELKNKKIEDVDKDRFATVLAQINVIGNKTNLRPLELQNRILDVIVGHLRFTEEILRFPALTGFLTLPQSQLKILMRVVEILYATLAKHYSHREQSFAQLEEELHNLLCFAFQFVHQVFFLYKQHIGVDDIRKLQGLLIAIGFPDSSRALFDAWVRVQIETQTAATTSAHQSPAKGGGHSSADKKKGSDEKKGTSKHSVGPQASSPQGHKKSSASSSKQVDPQKLMKTLKTTGYVNPTSVVTKCAYSVPEGMEAEVQLKFMGHQMRRSLGSAPDPRVKFNPDGWQVRLLNAIDEQRSALVCAPTGCGKTFACYYAMEKVLTYDNESVCVFVCPSKALVQQVQYEVNARFISKEYPPSCTTVLTGSMLPLVFEKVLKCQILLTIPSLFEMMLMSSRYRSWVSRLRYVILDEIHCIGEGDEEARSWERLIQLIPCPFLALSATVGNPGSFHQWLSAAHISSERRTTGSSTPPVEIIIFDERYADLSTYTYAALPTSQEIKDGDIQQVETEGLYALNPFVCVTYKQMLYEGLSKDFYIPSADMLKAYSSLRELLIVYFESKECVGRLSPIQREELNVFINVMTPANYFTNTAALSKRQYRYYLQWFKASLSYMVQSRLIEEPLYNLFIQTLTATSSLSKRNEVTGGTLWNPCMLSVSKEVLDMARRLGVQATAVKGTMDLPAPVTVNKSSNETRVNNCPISASTAPVHTITNTTEEPFMEPQIMVKFCRHLHHLGLLPTLMFNFNRGVVTHLCQSLVTLLADLQYKKFYGTPEAAAATRAANKKRLDEYKALLRHHEMMEKLKTVSKKTREEEDIAVEEDTSPLPPPPGDIADEYDEEFNFGNRRVWGTHHDEIVRIFDDVKRRLKKKDAFYMEALRRGIGFHHNGLGRRYRIAVEMLFRMGYLRIVFSTETLALGVNMPCKSTVFLGDSVQLTPLMFRQTSGRSGRRGFDVMGHIVFWNVPFAKMRRLLCARLPVLSGEFSVSPTQVLRVYQLISSVQVNHEATLQELRKGGSRQVDIRQKETEFAQELATLENNLIRLYRTPLYSVSSVDAQENLEELVRLRWATRYAFRFAADLLRRTQLLDGRANCVGLAGLMTFLYQEEPGNGALITSILHGGLLSWLEEAVPNQDEILPLDRQTSSTLPPWQIRRLLTFLSLCYAPVRLNYNVYLRTKLAKDIQPLLPSLAPSVKKALDVHNEMALKNAIGYVRSYSAAACKWSEEMLLPLSRLNFGPSSNQHQSFLLSESEVEPGTHVLSQLQGMEHRCFSRSPFVALSARSDYDFVSAFELYHSKPQGAQFDETFVSHVSPYMAKLDGKDRPLLSNYAVHFHGYRNERETAVNSCIDLNDLWDILTRYETGLKTLQTFLDKAVVGDSLLVNLVREAVDTFEQFKKAEAA